MKRSLKQTCLHHLTKTFGLEDYRPGQKEAVHALLSGRDVICILPTGAGKSLCWQLPAVVHPGLTVVVTPLIALMRDQVQHLNAAGVSAVSLDSLMSQDEKERALDAIRAGRARILFVSPERLEQSAFRRLCREMAPWLIVVDEAHCVVQWGEHFRPAYASIADFLNQLPVRPVLCALTATADDAMQRAIGASLGRKMKRILLPIVRENLVYEVRTTLDGTGEILRLLRRDACKTVVFCRTRQRTEHLAAILTDAGLPAAYYHAGMAREDRMAVQARFLDGTVQTLCATTAFGLGVDIPDIRRVIHDYLPDSLIDYVQQSGRAGRDGTDAECILLLEPNDLVAKASMKHRARDRIRRRAIRGIRAYFRARKGLRQLLRVTLSSNCIPAGIARAFGKRVPACGRCSACRKGRLVRRPPDAFNLSITQLRAWILMWQRNALASRLHIPRNAVLPNSNLYDAARRLVLPKDCQSRPELERILMHFRRERMHDNGSDGIQ